MAVGPCDVVNDDGIMANGSSLIDDIVREGPRRMLAAAVEAEVNAHIAELSDQRGDGSVARGPHGYYRPCP